MPFILRVPTTEYICAVNRAPSVASISRVMRAGGVWWASRNRVTNKLESFLRLAEI